MGAHKEEIEGRIISPDDSEYLDRVKRIKKEEARIKKLFGKIDEDRKKLVLSTIADVAFMTVTMQDLRETINREGTTAVYKNGENQYGTKQVIWITSIFTPRSSSICLTKSGGQISMSADALPVWA